MIIPWGEIRGAVEQAWKCHDPEVLVDGPRGTGKTTGLLLKALGMMEKYPGTRVLILRKTRAAMTESVLVTLESHILGAGHPMIGNISRANRASYNHPNGSCMVVGGLDKVDRTKSTDFDLIIIFEATECCEDDIETLTGSLRNNKAGYHQLIIDCNPKGSKHWIIQRAKSQKMTRFPSRHEDNPSLYGSDGTITEFGKQYIGTLDRLTGHRRQRDRFGIWASAEGLVYGDVWDESIHLIPRFEIPNNWRRIVTIDFGFTNPFVCQWWGIDGDSRMYRYREIYMTQRTVQEHWETIKKFSGENIEAWIADHDAEDRATLRKLGCYTQRAKKAIRPGIDATIERLKKAGDGKARLFYMKDSLLEVDAALVEAKKPYCTEHEYEGYLWAPPSEGRAAKEIPIQVDDHGLDGTRYGVAYVDNL